jgi:hypothetical protein
MGRDAMNGGNTGSKQNRFFFFKRGLFERSFWVFFKHWNCAPELQAHTQSLGKISTNKNDKKAVGEKKRRLKTRRCGFDFSFPFCSVDITNRRQKNSSDCAFIAASPSQSQQVFSFLVLSAARY